ncbi:hypothetical protein BD779DRAFT_1482529 [Infundibulicybe gibba]|nr:hypothetical protein BD779DRAFT_1482529 [Infundibulicybe gibba]
MYGGSGRRDIDISGLGIRLRKDTGYRKPAVSRVRVSRVRVPVWPYLNYESDKTTASRMTVLACKADLMLFQHIQYLNHESNQARGLRATVRTRDADLMTFEQIHYCISTRGRGSTVHMREADFMVFTSKYGHILINNPTRRQGSARGLRTQKHRRYIHAR